MARDYRRAGGDVYGESLRRDVPGAPRTKRKRQLRADPDGRQRGGIGDLLRNTGRGRAVAAADDFHCGTVAAGNRAHHRIAAPMITRCWSPVRYRRSSLCGDVQRATVRRRVRGAARCAATTMSSRWWSPRTVLLHAGEKRPFAPVLKLRNGLTRYRWYWLAERGGRGAVPSSGAD